MKETGSEDELLTDRVVMLSVVKTLVQRQRVDMEHIQRLGQRHAATSPEDPAERRDREIEAEEGTVCPLRCAAATRSENDTNTL